MRTAPRPLEEAERLCDRIAIIDHGHLIALGTPPELITRLEAPNIIVLLKVLFSATVTSTEHQPVTFGERRRA